MKRRRLPVPDADWPPPPTSNEPEVTLFNIPGSQLEGVNVVDVNAAGRLDIGTRVTASPAEAVALVEPAEVVEAPPHLDDSRDEAEIQPGTAEPLTFHAMLADLDLADARGSAAPSPAAPSAPVEAPTPPPAQPGPLADLWLTRPPEYERPRADGYRAPARTVASLDARRRSRVGSKALSAAALVLIAVAVARMPPDMWVDLTSRVAVLLSGLDPRPRPVASSTSIAPLPATPFSPTVGSTLQAEQPPVAATETGPSLAAPADAGSPTTPATTALATLERRAGIAPDPVVKQQPDEKIPSRLAPTGPATEASSARDFRSGPAAAPSPESRPGGPPATSAAASSEATLPPPSAQPVPSPAPAPSPAGSGLPSRAASAAEPPAPPPATTESPSSAARSDTVTPEPLRPETVRPDITSTAPPAAAATREITASQGMAATVKRLQLAYTRRDAALVKQVWPSVDERALERAFDGLRSQSVAFEQCETRVTTPTGEMQCRGVTTYVPRIGGQYPRTESRVWRFRMKKQGESWIIDNVTAR